MAASIFAARRMTLDAEGYLLPSRRLTLGKNASLAFHAALIATMKAIIAIVTRMARATTDRNI